MSNDQNQSTERGSSLIDLARLYPDMTINIKLCDLMTANKVLIDNAKHELLTAVQDANSDTLLTRKEVSEMLGKSEQTLWRWQQIGKLIPMLNGGTYQYLRSEVAAVMESLEAKK